MKESFLYSFAIHSVEVRPRGQGCFCVVYWSPTTRDFFSLEDLTHLDAVQLRETIKTRLALQWGAPNTEN